MRKFPIFHICLIIPALLFSCSPPPRMSDEYSAHISSDPDNMNPILSTDSTSSELQSYTFETLLQRNRDSLEFEPQLAERYEILDDGLRYRFHLRKDAKWSNGEPFTSEDIVFSFNTIMDKKTASAHLKVYYADIKSVKALDDYTVDFLFSRRYFKALESCADMRVISKKQYGSVKDINTCKENRTPHGTGPYVLLQWETGRRLVFTRNPHYYGKKPPFEKIIFKIIPDQNVALQLLKKGELDVVSLRPIQWIRQTNSEKFNSNFYKLKYYLPNYYYIAWNHKKEIFRDKETRRALGMLVNRKQIIDKLLFGQAVEVTGSFYVMGPDYDASLPPIPYDPGKAKELFASKGWIDSDKDGLLDRGGKKFAFNFLYAAQSKMSERFATIVKEDFKKNGVEVNIERLEWGSFLKRLDSHDFDAVILGWTMPFESDLYQVWHSSQMKDEGSNFISYSNPELDKLIEDVRIELDYGRRHVVYKKIHGILYEDQPYTFLYCLPTLVAVSKRFGNVNVHKAGLDYTEWVIRRD